MKLPKGVQDSNQHPQNAAVIAIWIDVIRDSPFKCVSSPNPFWTNRMSHFWIEIFSIISIMLTSFGLSNTHVFTYSTRQLYKLCPEYFVHVRCAGRNCGAGRSRSHVVSKHGASVLADMRLPLSCTMHIEPFYSKHDASIYWRFKSAIDNMLKGLIPFRCQNWYQLTLL